MTWELLDLARSHQPGQAADKLPFSKHDPLIEVNGQDDVREIGRIGFRVALDPIQDPQVEIRQRLLRP